MTRRVGAGLERGKKLPLSVGEVGEARRSFASRKSDRVGEWESGTMWTTYAQ